MHIPTQPAHGTSVDRLDSAVWHKSSYSGTQGNCIEIAHDPAGFVTVRDSKNPDGPKLLIAAAEWRAFLNHLRDTKPGFLGA
jgi:hypothetical protein